MTFMSMEFIIFTVTLLVVFYAVPVKLRRWVLLAASVVFYYIICAQGIVMFLSTIAISFFAAKLIVRTEDNARKIVLFLSVAVIALPLFMLKEGNYIISKLGFARVGIVVPLGLAFYTLQIIAYLVDVYRGKYLPEKNIFSYALFVSYFPQILQGPIPRFERLDTQLKKEHRLNEEMFVKGFQLIIWGWFLKLMIADKASIIVDTVFEQSNIYRGSYILVAGVLYSIQLYADFQSCVCIAKGISEMLGIELDDNFNHPYFSQSIAEFWRRWHISLSSWLKDYIYIPLGGNRKGTVRKYINIIIVFIVSGIWHGEGIKYIIWGLMHGFYQVCGAITYPLRDRLRTGVKLNKDDILLVTIRRIITFMLVMVAWIVFRANSVAQAVDMLCSLAFDYNPWILFNDSLFELGLSWKECVVLAGSVLTLLGVSAVQEKKSIRDIIMRQNIAVRWLICIGAIIVILIFGTYGIGYDAKAFIYGGF